MPAAGPPLRRTVAFCNRTRIHPQSSEVSVASSVLSDAAAGTVVASSASSSSSLVVAAAGAECPSTG